MTLLKSFDLSCFFDYCRLPCVQIDFIMLYASRRSRFSRKKSILYAVLLAVLGLFLNAKCTFTLFLEFDIVLGLSAAWLALFFMRGWWSVFVSIPAAIATVPLYGQPVAALLFVMEVFVVTLIYRNLVYLILCLFSKPNKHSLISYCWLNFLKF